MASTDTVGMSRSREDLLAARLGTLLIGLCLRDKQPPFRVPQCIESEPWSFVMANDRVDAVCIIVRAVDSLGRGWR